MSDINKPATTNNCTSTPCREQQKHNILPTTPTRERSDERYTRASHRLTPSRSGSVEHQFRAADMSPDAVAKSRCNKPECSYAVLIGIAMRAAQAANYGHRLPVIEIYRFIE